MACLLTSCFLNSRYVLQSKRLDVLVVPVRSGTCRYEAPFVSVWWTPRGSLHVLLCLSLSILWVLLRLCESVGSTCYFCTILVADLDSYL